jgi:hypothetical protein
MNDQYKEAAEEMDARKDTGHEMDGLVPVQGRVKQNADSIYSVRFTKDELRDLRLAAESKGLKLSEVIRKGALDFARDGRPAPAVDEVRTKVKELAEAVSRL